MPREWGLAAANSERVSCGRSSSSIVAAAVISRRSRLLGRRNHEPVSYEAPIRDLRWALGSISVSHCSTFDVKQLIARELVPTFLIMYACAAASRQFSVTYSGLPLRESESGQHLANVVVISLGV
jgi:hypothetical protein